MTQTAAIIGGGVIGGGWAARLTLNGWDVRIYAPDPESTRKINEVIMPAAPCPCWWTATCRPKAV